MSSPSQPPKRLLILISKLGYQARAFADAARRLGAEVVFATDRCHQLDDPWQDAAIPLHFERPADAAAEIARAATNAPIHAILALGDRPLAAAAHAARSLGLPYNSPESVETARNKFLQRERLSAARVPVPQFFSFALDDDLGPVLPRVQFPSVVKPLMLSMSQGVVRADGPDQFRAAVARIRALVQSPEIQVTREAGLDRLLVENFLPGPEIALEGLLEDGSLRTLAIFDKPDPLEGPYFEETIYVTPSRLAPRALAVVEDCARQAVAALGLTRGPIHAEFRVNARGPWVLEVQPRPIGGLCARALRFGPEKIPLEELLVRHALGMDTRSLQRESAASGVMMIPVPSSGILEGVAGIEEAARLAHIESVEITARPHDYIAAWPEGSSYLGFIFARAPQPAEVESALRAAHACLCFDLRPRLPVEHPLAQQAP
ncbi:MAG TPA: ATP-grasp domain-containing protein [Candidatus Acidoferrales bacterium]|nr:ATP-grasp domain-containing protein [Candidatus Acidoferrales bacterium]